MQALADILRKENRTHLVISQLQDNTCQYYAEGNADVLQKMLSQLFIDFLKEREIISPQQSYLWFSDEILQQLNKQQPQ